MKIKPELEKQINQFRYAIDSYEFNFSNTHMPCYYFNSIFGDGGILSKASCADCRAESMDFDEDGSTIIDCYTLMILDFLKSCGVEVEDEV